MADIDRDLARLQRAVERAGASLLELEQNPNRALLASAALEGETARRWDFARQALAELFDGYKRLMEVHERAMEIRGSRAKPSAAQEAQLEQLLYGHSIELPPTGVSLADRDLLSGSTVIARCSLDALLASMERSFADAKDVLVSVGEAWDVVAPRVGAIRNRLSAVKETAASLGQDAANALARVDVRLTAISDAVLTDPLSIDVHSIGQLEDTVEDVVRECAEVRGLRDGFDRCITDARSRLDELAAAVDSGTRAREQTTAKIAEVNGPEPLDLDPRFADTLDCVAAMAARGEWRAANAALQQWRMEVDEVLARALGVTATYRGLLQERDELRSRLDAYKAKAGDEGRAEDPRLAGLYENAEAVLYTAPTDLEEAQARVLEYQAAVSQRTPTPEVGA